MFLSYNQVLVQFIFSILVAILTTQLFQNSIPNSQNNDRLKSLDGLRGLLSFFVFQHHAFIWYFMIHSKRWAAPQNQFVKNLGEVSVVFFFLITGFLFTHKIRTTNSTIDWRKLYLSRARRLFPLYGFAILIMCILIFINIDGTLHQPISSLAVQVAHWFSFNLFLKQDHLDINGFHNTHLILAGVTWTLKFEWLFYLSLPFIAFFGGKKPAMIWLVVGIIAFYFLIMLSISQRRLFLVLAFIIGGLASKINEYRRLTKISRTKIASFLLVFGLILTYCMLSKAFSYAGVLIISILFVFIVAGTNLFGLLEHPILMKIGNISYSVYLLHGLVLFCCFYMIIGLKVVRKLSEFEYTLLISFITAIVISISIITYRFIEHRFIQKIT